MPREILAEGVKAYETGVATGLYVLGEKDIRVLAQADLYRLVMIGEAGCSEKVRVEAGQKLMELRETKQYKVAEDKLFVNRK